jgi:hypothetical protein
MTRSTLVVAGEFASIDVGYPATSIEVLVDHYLEGSGPPTLDILESTAECGFGVRAEEVGEHWIVGIERQPRGELMLGRFALATPDQEDAVVAMLRNLGVTPPRGTGIEETPHPTAVLPIHVLVLALVLTVTGGARLVTRR